MSKRLLMIMILVLISSILNNSVNADGSSVLVGRYPLELIKGETTYEPICFSSCIDNDVKPKSVLSIPSWRYEDKYDLHPFALECIKKGKFRIGDNEYDIEAGYAYIKISLQDDIIVNGKGYIPSDLSFDEKLWRQKPYEIKSSYTEKYEFIDEQIKRCILVYHKYDYIIGLNSARKYYDTPRSPASAYVRLSSHVSLGIAERLVAKKQYKKMQIIFTIFDENFDGKFTRDDRFSIDYYNNFFNFGEKIKISLPKKILWFKGLDKKNTHYYIVDLIEEDGNYILDIKSAD